MSQLPEGWIETSFMEVFDIQGGTQPPKAQFKYEPHEGYIRLLQIRDFGDRPVPTYIPNKAGLKICDKDDILIGRYGASVGRICTGMEGAYNVALAKVITPHEIDKRFVFYLLQSDLFQKPILATERSAQDGFNKDDLERIIVPLMPLAEQCRIVAKLEILLGKVEACQQRLAKIPVILKRFRQAVLAAACSGELTVDWRELNREANPAIEILNSISVSPLQQSEWPDEETPPTWVWVQFGKVIEELRNGVPIRPNMEPPGLPILRISAARPGKVDLDDIRFLPTGEGYLPQYGLKDNDLLFTRYNGSLELLGVCGMVRGLENRTILYPDKLMRVRFETDQILPGYAEIFFQVNSVHERIIAKSKSSAGQNGVSGTDIKAQPFVLPPLAEQQEIVRRVEAMFQLADQLETRYRRAKAQVDKLQQSILAKAFRGELVPTEAELARQEGREHESAAMLLERIRAQRTSEDAKPKSTFKIRTPAMTKVTKEIVIEVIDQFSQDRFSFDDLRKKVPADYESLKEIVFALLSEPEPQLMQVFDQEAKAMRFARSHK